MFSADLELELHPRDGRIRLEMRQMLDVHVKVVGGDLRVAGFDRLEQRHVDEDVLILCLDHVVTLRPEARHMTVDVQRLLVTDAVKHCVDDNERACPADPGAVHKMLNRYLIFHVSRLHKSSVVMITKLQCRSRSWITTVALALYNGKYQNL